VLVRPKHTGIREFRTIPVRMFYPAHHFDKTLWPKCHIQWLYLAAHGCKTYLNLNLNLNGVHCQH
jgi:hypothetical protein